MTFAGFGEEVMRFTVVGLEVVTRGRHADTDREHLPLHCENSIKPLSAARQEPATLVEGEGFGDRDRAPFRCQFPDETFGRTHLVVGHRSRSP